MRGFGENHGGAVSARIVTSALTEADITIDTDTEYRYGEVTALTLDMPSDISDDYAAWLVFKSGGTASEVSYPDNIKWSGDDVVDGIFEPSENKIYNIGLWYDGININAVVRGVDA